MDRIMNLARFRQIISAFHPEAGESAVSYKCHQLRYTIISVNDAASKTFDLGPTAAFDEGDIEKTQPLLLCEATQ